MDLIENMFTLDLPEKKTSSPLLDFPSTESSTTKKGRKVLTAAERLLRKKDREEAALKEFAPKAHPPMAEKLDLKEATKSIGGILIAMSKTKQELSEGEIKALSSTAELSLAQVIQVQDEETNKWIVHSQTAIVWIGTLLPRFMPQLFVKRNGEEKQTEEKKGVGE